MAWKEYYTPHDIREMFPEFSFMKYCYGNKMYYLGRYNNSQYWAGRYKNGQTKLVQTDMCGSLEFDIKFA